MAAEKLTEVPLCNVQLHKPEAKNVSNSALSFANIVQEDDIDTSFGPIHVQVQGERGKPAIFTYHDIGLNSVTCFQGFFQYPEMSVILSHFTVYHINALGQQEGALPLPQGISHIGDAEIVKNYEYPSMDHLASMLLTVLQYYGLKSFLGFGVGAGGNVLSRFALSNPDKVDGLCLINCTSSRSSWTEWGSQKLNNWYLKSGQLSAATESYLLWHWFGKKTLSENTDLVVAYTDYLKNVNPTNLSFFMDAYIQRTDLDLMRVFDPDMQKQVRNFRCPVMLVAGDYSPHLDQVIHMNGQLDPSDSTWMKFECGGMVHEEAPGKLCEAFRLFLQGMGYIPTLSRMAINKKLSQAQNSHPSGDVANKAKAREKPSAPITDVQTVC